MNFNLCNKSLLYGLDPLIMPKHVAIIMDGNGRWAKRRVIERLKGHERGANVVCNVVKVCRELGIPVLTLYAFSTENWQRSKNEISGLMCILQRFLKSNKNYLLQNKISLNVIGQTYRLPHDVKETLDCVVKDTRSNSLMQLNLALSYGGRADIIDAVVNLVKDVESGYIKLNDIIPDLFTRYLSTGGFPDPDILIRTGGDLRLSNFFLWQVAYTEFFFTPTLWPDFNVEEFVQIVKEFQKRDRRYGAVVE